MLSKHKNHKTKGIPKTITVSGLLLSNYTNYYINL